MTTSHHPRRFCAILILAGVLGGLAVHQVAAGTNPDFRIVLHAKPSSFETCNGYLPVDCVNNSPTVNLPQATPIALFILIYNYTAASGITTGIEWSGWSRTFSLYDCLRLCDPIPCPPPFPMGNFEIVNIDFTGCVTAPALAPVGRIFLVPAGNAGCISQFTTMPFGAHLRDCSGGIDQITDAASPRLGKVCVGTGGVNACEGVVPVESATWGQIKSTY